MLHFREVTLDAFHLFDKDNDNKLRKFTLDADLENHEGDINEEFWKHLESNLDDPKGKDSQEWVESVKKRADKDIDYHDYQKLLWTGHVQNELDFEQMQKNVYKSKTKYYFSFLLDIRSSTFRSKLSPQKAKDSVLTLIMNVLFDILHLLDIVSDGNLARKMYGFSRHKEE